LKALHLSQPSGALVESDELCIPGIIDYDRRDLVFSLFNCSLDRLHSVGFICGCALGGIVLRLKAAARAVLLLGQKVPSPTQVAADTFSYSASYEDDKYHRKL
jgi:hypothetical protein